MILLKLEVSFFHSIFKHLTTTIFKERLSWILLKVVKVERCSGISKNTYFLEYLSPFTACFSLTFWYLMVKKVVLKLYKSCISAENAFILADCR